MVKTTFAKPRYFKRAVISIMHRFNIHTGRKRCLLVYKIYKMQRCAWCAWLRAICFCNTVWRNFLNFHGGNVLLPMTNGGELAALYSLMFLLLVFTGGGKYALDAVWGKKQG